MDIDTEACPIDYIANYDEHLGCKPIEEAVKGKLHNKKWSLDEKSTKEEENEARSYRKHGDTVKWQKKKNWNNQ